ncbi:MAG: hypothetical protein ABR600_13480, partial [Actinomycetota bacterium]
MPRWIAVAAGLVLMAACTGSNDETSGSPGTPSPTGSLVRIHPGGQELFTPPPSIPPELKPYAFSRPTPPAEPSVLDGTYMKIVPLEGRVEAHLPIKCFRCIPYRPDVGVSTLVIYQGAYYVYHQLSGVKAAGSFTVSGHSIELFNDANCPQD